MSTTRVVTAYLCHVAIEAVRVRAETIRVRTGIDTTQVEFVVDGKAWPCPAVPERLEGRLVPVLHTLSGVGEVAYATDEPGTIKLQFAGMELPLAVTFSVAEGVETVHMDVRRVWPLFPYLGNK